MPVTQDEWFASRVANLAKARSPVLDHKLLEQAEVASALLTAHPAWDVYLQRLQVTLNTARGELAAWQATIGGAMLDSDLRMIQNQCNRCLAQIETLTYCMALPKEILAHARDHKDGLDNAAQ